MTGSLINLSLLVATSNVYCSILYLLFLNCTESADLLKEMDFMQGV